VFFLTERKFNELICVLYFCEKIKKNVVTCLSVSGTSLNVPKIFPDGSAMLFYVGSRFLWVSRICLRVSGTFLNVPKIFPDSSAILFYIKRVFL